MSLVDACIVIVLGWVVVGIVVALKDKGGAQ
jgi:hypothetical protein